MPGRPTAPASWQVANDEAGGCPVQEGELGGVRFGLAWPGPAPAVGGIWDMNWRTGTISLPVS